MTAWLESEVLRFTEPSAPPRTTMRMPENSRNPPRVTIKDGILSRALSVPWRAPNTPQAASAARMAAHHGQPAPGCWTSLNAITPPISATAPTERSISAMSRTKVSAIASTMYTVLSPKIYTRLLGRRKLCSGVMIWKTTATTTMARSTGRTPLSPPRTRAHEARRYWPSDWARSSGGMSATDRSGAAASSTASASVWRGRACAVSAGVWPGSAVTGFSPSGAMGSALATNGCGRLGRPPVGGTRRHVLHHALPVEVRGRPLGHHPAQVQHRDPVRDLENVVQVVGDHHHRQPAVAQADDQVKHGPGLHHPEGGGGLVKQHHLGVPHHRLGDRHRLTLTSRERGHGLPDRAYGGHPQGAQGLGRLLLHRVLVEQAVAQRLPAEEHVLDDVQVVGQRQILVDGLDPQCGGVPGGPDVYQPPLEEDLTVVRLVHAGDGAGEHRLPGTVVPAQAGHQARGQVQVHPVERLHRPEVLVDAPQLQQRFRPVDPVPARARAVRGLVYLSHCEYPSVAMPRLGSRRCGIRHLPSITAVLPSRPSRQSGMGTTSHQAGVGGPLCWRVRQPRRGGAFDENPSRFPRSDDYEIPAAVQRAAPAIAQMAEAGSKPSLTTVASMLALVTQTGVSRDAGSVMVGSAGSTVVLFSRAAGGLSPASRIVAMATASWASK